MELLTTAVSRELLTGEPFTALRLLAGEVRLLHRRMHPAEVLFIQVTEGVLAMGRHEVPALAMLFEQGDIDPRTTGVALARAAAYLDGARLDRA
jgi:hypothetical protein